MAATASASVTDAVVDAYVAEHGNERVPERRDARLVLTRGRPEAISAKRELLAGASWRSVARRYSIDTATNRDGGRLAAVERAAPERRLARALFRARRDRVVGPVRTRFGYYVFEVTRIRPAHELSAARSRAIVRPLLVARAQEAAIDRFVTEYRAKWLSRTVCAPTVADHPDCGPSGR